MAGTWKTVRVFISSTFRDMQAERDHLVRFVFPRLREDLLKHRIHLIDVDLRWGVTSEQDAVGVCREVIDECRPRFMGILGGRYGWVPEGKTESITADEIHYAVLGRAKENRGQCFFYFRDNDATRSMVEATPGDYREAEGSVNAGKLAELKEAIIKADLPLFIYGAQWSDSQQRLTGLEAFGDRVHADLIQSLKADPELSDRFAADAEAKEPDEFAEEAYQMDAFIEERTERFVLGSREPLMRDLLDFAAADGTPNVFVLTGDPGSGKSAFLAKFTRELSVVPHSPITIPHFIGASAGSTDLRRTLRRLCHELGKAAGSSEPLPLDIKDLIDQFQKLLAEAGSKQRVVLVFDALNQLDATDGAHWLNWLPRDLPPSVRIVASVIAPLEGEQEHQTLAILRNRKDAWFESLKLLDETDTLAIIEGYLKRYAKRLSPEQIAALLEKPAGRLPLYILTALEELRTLGTYEEITDRIHALPGDACALFGWILTERLAKDPGFRDQEGQTCGAALVEKFAACLGVSRHGLSPAELTALLDPGDPLGNVAALLRLLRPYLMRRGELLDFYHGQFREAAKGAYLDTPVKQGDAHCQLANHFEKRASPVGDDRWDSDDKRAFGELPIHRAAEARASGKPEVLYRLVDDTQFRAKSFEIAHSADPVSRDLDVALELAVINDDAGKLFHFALIRARFLRELTESYLHNISSLAEKEPELAYSVVALVPDAAYRRLGLVALAAKSCRDIGSASFVERLLQDALRIRDPATVAQTPVLLLMARSLCEAGFPNAANLSSCVPDSPARTVWMAVSRDSARSPSETFKSPPSAPADEIERFQAIRKAVQPFLAYQRRIRSQYDFEQFEETLFRAHGWDGPGAAYCIQAAEFFASANEEMVLPVLGRAIFITCKVGIGHLRTEAALAEMFSANGEHDAANEALARARMIAKHGHARARTTREREWLADAERELLIAGERAATVWRPPGSRELVNELRTGTVEDRANDLAAILSRTRLLLAEGNREAVPSILQRLLDNPTAIDSPAMLAIHALSRAAGDLPHSEESARLLMNAGLDSSALFDSGRHSELPALFGPLAQADVRIVGVLAFSLREAGSRRALLELARSVATGRGDILSLDAVLPELIRLCAKTGEVARSMEAKTLAATDHLTVPSGMGMYYYPGVMYLVAWSGLICVMAAAMPLLVEPHRLLPGLIALALLPIGGLLDMLLWDCIGIWKNPAKSRRLFVSQGGTVLMLLVLGWVVGLIDNSERQIFGLGMMLGIGIMLVNLFTSIFTLYISIKWQLRSKWLDCLFTWWWKFLPFIRWQPHIKWLGSLAAFTLGCVLALAVGRLAVDWRPFLAGVFFAGGLELGWAFAILPLRHRVCRFLDETLPQNYS
jgi:hypothetical protein